jgi:hypothetical protein
MDAKASIESVTRAGIDRREFTLRSLLAMLSGVTITVSGCGGGGGSPTQPTPQPSTGGDKTGNVSSNHGHVAVITSAQLTAAGALTLDIRGQADHPHTVQLTAAEVGSIAAGQRVGRASSEQDFHTHTVTFN